MHACNDTISLEDEVPLVGAVVAVMLAEVAAYLGLWAFGGTQAGGVGAGVLLLAVVAVVVLLAVDQRLERDGGLAGVIRELIRLRRSRVAHFAATLCPHGVQLRKPGAEPVLLPWSQVRQIGVLSHWRGPVVAAELVPGADPIGMPAVGRLVRGTSDDPGLVWLGRVPRGRRAAVRAGIQAWQPSALRS
jgi:hypothetical protein